LTISEMDLDFIPKREKVYAEMSCEIINFHDEFSALPCAG